MSAVLFLCLTRTEFQHVFFQLNGARTSAVRVDTVGEESYSMNVSFFIKDVVISDRCRFASCLALYVLLLISVNGFR